MESDVDSTPRRLIRPSAVITVWCWIAAPAMDATAQQSGGTVTETVTMHRDLNGKDRVTEKVVTHRARTNDEERVVIEVIETYLP